MFESDRLPQGWAQRLASMSEVWVPTKFHRAIFLRDSPLPASRVRIVPEAVDTDVFNTNSVQSLGNQPWLHTDNCTRFLSVFKWEHRKGWDVLLSAWWGAFNTGEAGSPPNTTGCARLHIRTSAYHSTDDFTSAVDQYLLQKHGCSSDQWDSQRSVLGLSGRSWCFDDGSNSILRPTEALRRHRHDLPAVMFVPQMSEQFMPRLYRSMDCLVLPSRGEGWGRPHVEAMAMALPVIATNWSGPTEYMTASNSLPLKILGLKTMLAGPFTGHKFAEPDLMHLIELMRWVHTHPEQAAALGRQAQEDMQRRFSVPVVTGIVLKSLAEINSQSKLGLRDEL